MIACIQKEAQEMDAVSGTRPLFVMLGYDTFRSIIHRSRTDTMIWDCIALPPNAGNANMTSSLRHDLENLGIINVVEITHNPSYDQNIQNISSMTNHLTIRFGGISKNHLKPTKW